ncbi:MAG TPA: PepSY domain-containing protein [Microvirga sp.]|nr:PepSY domain-containing protein [Microvirga sp.]
MKPFLLGGAVLALTTALAAAQTTPAPAPDATGATTTAPAPGGTGRAGSSDFQALQAVKVPLSQAIATVEQQGQGRAISAEFEAQDGNEPAHYEIKVVQNDGKLVEHEVDANTGQVIKTENQPIERFFTRLKPADFQSARMSLKDAIATAEQRAGAGARAVEAEVDRENNAVVYEIEVATAERSQEVKIDANGQVVSTD